MQGIILTGGRGSRLWPLTRDTNKHLLDICGRPMVYYSLSIFLSAGVTDITLVTNPEHIPLFQRAIKGSFLERFTPLRIVPQTDKPGIAGSIQMMPPEHRVGPYLVVLGDNILGGSIRDARERFEKKPESALILLTEVQSPEAFGVALLKGGKIVAIEEKPENPDSQFAIPGIYFFPKDVFQIAGGVNPSARGEYEVTDILCEYLRQGRLEYQMLTHWWVDAGTHESLAEAKQLIRRDGVWQEKDWVA